MATVDDHIETLQMLSGDVSTLDGPGRVELVRRVGRLRGWVDAGEAQVLAVIDAKRDDIDTGAKDITQLAQRETGVGYGCAKRAALRAKWLPQLDTAADALAAGAVGTEQIDALCALADRLPADKHPHLLDDLAELVLELAELTPPRAVKRLLEWERSHDTDDGESRLEGQRRANRFGYAKNGDGTTNVFGCLDPISAERVRTAIDAKVTELWRLEAKGRADMAPPGQALTNPQRRAKALVELIAAGAVAPPSPISAGVLVLIDHQTLLGQIAANPIARLGDGTQLPAGEARRLACDADIIPIVLGGPSQPLDVGYLSRGATKAQRAALRAVHNTCCVDNCDVPFDWCEIHHIIWWLRGGPTDLDNLAPLCSKHHHLVHDDDWNLTLDHNRVGHLTHRTETTLPTAGTHTKAPRPRVTDRPPRTARTRAPAPTPDRPPGTRPASRPRTASSPRKAQPAGEPPPEHHQPMRC